MAGGGHLVPEEALVSNGGQRRTPVKDLVLPGDCHLAPREVLVSNRGCHLVQSKGLVMTGGCGAVPREAVVSSGDCGLGPREAAVAAGSHRLVINRGYHLAPREALVIEKGCRLAPREALVTTEHCHLAPSECPIVTEAVRVTATQCRHLDALESLGSTCVLHVAAFVRACDPACSGICLLASWECCLWGVRDITLLVARCGFYLFARNALLILGKSVNQFMKDGIQVFVWGRRRILGEDRGGDVRGHRSDPRGPGGWRRWALAAALLAGFTGSSRRHIKLRIGHGLGFCMLLIGIGEVLEEVVDVFKCLKEGVHLCSGPKPEAGPQLRDAASKK